MRHLLSLYKLRAILLFGVIFIILSVSNAKAYQTEHVVVVLIDGVRYTEGLGTANCPRLNALAAQAVIQDSAFNDSITVTSSAVPATWMGRFYPLQDTTYLGNDIQFCRYPTYWEYARKDLGFSANQVIYVTPNYGTGTWMPSFYPGYGPSYWPQFVQPPISTGNNNIACFDSAVTVIRRQHPKVMYVYFPDTDHAGHSGIWEDYLAKIREADSLTKALWDTIQTDIVMANKTTMFVTNDHGRHTTNFTGHGDGCFGCRHVMMFAIGPDFKRNVHFNSPRARMTDITKTAGELLGYQSPYSTGRVMIELFDESGPNCHAYIPGDINSDSSVQGSDVTFGVRYFKGLGLQPPDSCFIDSLNGYLYIRGDVNGNCEFRGSDITRLIAYFKGMADLAYCHWVLPVPPLKTDIHKETRPIIHE
ncbi:MAG: hypothetical protein GX409_11600 [candidate division Zixibacteria bacterium]|nr:hypothetical protein [candidate division Zixibacteria bacterium]